MAKKTMCFDLSSSSIKIKELMQTKDFIMIELWAISDEYPNNNKSHFPYNTMKSNVKNKVFFNKPILGKFNNITLNYEVHNSQNKYDPEYDLEYKDYENGERPLGVIRESDNVRIEIDENGLHWIVFTAILWVKYNYQGVKKILKSKTSKVSVEVTVTKSHLDENKIEIFDEWMFDGVTILGYRPNTKIVAKEGINNAHLTILEKMGQSEFSHQIRSLQFAYDEFDKNNDIKENDSRLYIEKNEEEGGIKLLTYEQKIGLLQEKLHSFLDLDKEWGYVCDLDDNNVYFRIGDVTYRTSYSFNEDETECTLDFDQKIRVINTWKDFETEMSESENEQQSFEENEFKEDSCEKDGSKEENTSEEKVESKDDCNDDKNDKDDCDDCDNKDDEEKDVEEKCEKQESESNSDGFVSESEFKDDEEKDDPEQQENESNSDDESDKVKEKEESSDLDGEAFEDTDNNVEESEKDSEEKNEDCCVKSTMEAEQMFVIEETQCTANEVYDKYISLKQTFDNLEKDYNDLSAKFDNCQKQCDEFSSELKKIEYEKMSVEVKELATKAKFSKEEIDDYVNRCKNGEFSTIEEATKEIAYKAFMNSDADDNNANTETQVEFSAKADVRKQVISNMSKTKISPIDNLKQYINK